MVYLNLPGTHRSPLLKKGSILLTIIWRGKVLTGKLLTPPQLGAPTNLRCLDGQALVLRHLYLNLAPLWAGARWSVVPLLLLSWHATLRSSYYLSQFTRFLGVKFNLKVLVCVSITFCNSGCQVVSFATPSIIMACHSLSYYPPNSVRTPAPILANGSEWRRR